VTAAGQAGDPAGGAAGRVRGVAGELILVAAVAALGVFVLIDTTGIRVPGSSNTIGPRFFPYLVGGLLVATAAALAVQVLRGRAAPPEEGEDVDVEAGTDWRTVAIVIAGFGVHALLIEPVGWPIAVTVMFAVVSLALGSAHPVRTVLIGLALSITVWLVFVLALGLSLPGGPLEWVVYG
jgi:putative tricarboxylic transport membrane protein